MTGEMKVEMKVTAPLFTSVSTFTGPGDALDPVHGRHRDGPNTAPS